MDQFAQVAGALLVLAAFVRVQLGRLSPRARRCLFANVAGSAWPRYTHDRAREATA